MATKSIVFIYFGILMTLGALGQRTPRAGPSPSSSKDEIAIISQSQEVNFDGSFSAAYETANGIVFSETGELKNAGQENAEAEVIKGSVSWTAPEGEKISLSWTADENGAVFEGDHLPTPPPTQPIPEAIRRSIEFNAKNPSKDAE